MFFNKKELSKEQLMESATFSLILSIAKKVGMTPAETVVAMNAPKEVNDFLTEMTKAQLDTIKNKDNK